MKCTITLISLWVALLTTACSTLRQNDSQFQIMGRADERGVVAPVSPGDRQAVKQILTSLAAQWGLQDRAAGSFLPTLIVSYSQDWNRTPNPLNLVAFEHEGKIIIDMIQRSPGIGETAQYRARRDQLVGALREKFGKRAVIPQLIDYVRHVQAGKVDG